MRKWRVGTISMALLLIVLGITILLSQLIDSFKISYIIKWWPVVLIILGIEILLHAKFSNEENPKINFDFKSIILIILILFMSSIFALFTVVTENIDSNEIFSFIKVYKYETNFVKTEVFDKNNLENFILNENNNDITINGTENDEINIKATFIVKNNNEELVNKLKNTKEFYKISKKDDNLIILNKTNEIESEYKDINNIYIKYVIDVPNDLNIKISSTNGNIKLNNIKNALDIENTNGDINLKSVNDINIISQNSDIVINKSDGKLNLDCENSTIALTEILGQLKGYTNNCDLNFSNNLIKNDIDLNSTNGVITFDTGKTENYDINAKVINGVIEGKFKSESVANSNSNKIEKTIGNGGSIIKLDIVNGDLNLF
jgi:hypothetical protein